jgi:xanthine dehydrogenase large subunit
MFVMESAITAAAEALEMDRSTVQERNLLVDGDQLPFGMRIERCRARRAFEDACTRFDLAATREAVRRHNAEHRMTRRGLAVMPVCFGISFTSTFLNQASALVHVYTDGSVGVSTAAVEMGQGVNMKIRGIAAHTLGIAPERIVVASTNTTRVANTSPTAASSGADMNGRATELACRSIVDRLLRVAAELQDEPVETLSIRDGTVLRNGEPTELAWDELVWSTYFRRVSLSAQAHYATPGLSYDKSTESGTPFAYHVYGTAIVEVTVDCLRGIYTVDRVRLVHDAGRSLDLLIDRGQVEGGLLQGVGWMTMEEVCHDGGRLTSDSMTTYKVPDVHSAPEVETVFLEDADNPRAVLHSKAIGEPPFMYGIGVYFALLDALRQARPDRPGFFDAPMTPEKVLLFLHGGG